MGTAPAQVHALAAGSLGQGPEDLSGRGAVVLHGQRRPGAGDTGCDPRRVHDAARAAASWDVIVQPGRVWSEPGDGGWSRASFPFALVHSIEEPETHNGVATFLYKDGQVSDLTFQVVQQTSPYYVVDYFPAPGAGRRPEAVDAWCTGWPGGTPRRAMRRIRPTRCRSALGTTLKPRSATTHSAASTPRCRRGKSCSAAWSATACCI